MPYGYFGGAGASSAATDAGSKYDWSSLFGGGSSGGGGGGTDWYGALLGGLSSYSQGRQQGKDVDRQGEWTMRGIQEGGRQSRGNSEFDASLVDHYRRLQQQERRLGLSNFGSFARNEYDAPAYVPPVVGAAPTANGFESTFNPPKPDKGKKSLAGAARG